MACPTVSVRAALGGFALEKRPLPLDAPAVAGERAVARDHAMTRDDDGERIRAARRADGTSRVRTTEARRELAVRRGGSSRNGAQGPPDLTLEPCAAQIERYVECGRWCIDERGDLRRERVQRRVGSGPFA